MHRYIRACNVTSHLCLHAIYDRQGMTIVSSQSILVIQVSNLQHHLGSPSMHFLK